MVTKLRPRLIDASGLQPKPLNTRTLGVVLSSIGWPGAPVGLPAGETNPNLTPFRGRGIWPSPGIWHHIVRSNPIASAGVSQIKEMVASLHWRSLPPRDATPEEKVRSDWMADSLKSLPGGGFPGFVQRVFGAVIYGFSLFESQWEVEDDTLWSRLANLHWIPPWTIHQWVSHSESGELLGVIQRSEKGESFIPVERLNYFANREFYGGNWESVSSLRPLWGPNRAFEDRLISDGIAWERYAEGTVVATPPADVDRDQNAAEFAEMESILEDWESGESSWIVNVPGWSIDFNYGGTQIPDPRSRMEFYSHLFQLNLGDVVKDLGRARYGSKAVGETITGEQQRQLSGVCGVMCAMIDEGPIGKTWRANGWDGLYRQPRTTVSGFIDEGLLGNIHRYATSGLFGELTEEDRQNFRELVGLRVED